jgi:hypothetical protein
MSALVLQRNILRSSTESVLIVSMTIFIHCFKQRGTCLHACHSSIRSQILLLCVTRTQHSVQCSGVFNFILRISKCGEKCKIDCITLYAVVPPVTRARAQHTFVDNSEATAHLPKFQ